MKVKLIEPQQLGALEIVEIDRLRVIKDFLRRVKCAFISCFPTRLVLWADFYVYDPQNKAYVPYGVYNKRVAFLEIFSYQQRTRQQNIKNSAPVGCLE